MAIEFIGKPIEVELSEETPPAPTAFRLGGQRHEVAEVLSRWEEHGYGQRIRGHLDRQPQGQRFYYRVRTAEGEVFELYVDWSPVRRKGTKRSEKSQWFAHRRLS